MFSSLTMSSEKSSATSISRASLSLPVVARALSSNLNARFLSPQRLQQFTSGWMQVL